MRSFMPYMMRGRNESVVYHEQIYDLTRTRPWLRQFNRQRERPATLFHLCLWAFAQGLHQRPGLNRFVSGGHLYQRKGVYISFAAKKELADDAPLVTVKMEFPPGEPFGAFVDRVTAAIGEGRSGPGRTVDKELALAMKLPGWMLSGLMALLRFLDRVNLMPGWMIENDPMFTSLFVANLGSVGLDKTYHHLYEWGTAGLFGCLGMPRKMPLPGRDGQPVVRDAMEVRWTLDERVNDALYCFNSLRIAKQIIENPEAHLASGLEVVALKEADQGAGEGPATGEAGLRANDGGGATTLRSGAP